VRKAQCVNILLKLAGDRTEVLGVTLTILDWISSIASRNSPKSIARTGEAKSATAARAKAIDFMMRIGIDVRKCHFIKMPRIMSFKEKLRSAFGWSAPWPKVLRV
jgi:hypothetical protein